MRPFKYLEPKTVEEACSMLAEHGEEAKLLAGGQSLIPLLQQRLISPGYIINLKGVPGLDHLRNGGDSLKLGALTLHRAVETSPVIKARFPMLSEMERTLGSVQIRNWGTLGGNLCHADPGGDPGPALIALGASVKAASVRGERWIDLEDFFRDYLTSGLAPDEILTEIEAPYPPPLSGGAFHKESVRLGDMAIASTAAYVVLEGKDGPVKDLRIVLGAVGSTPLRAGRAEKVLRGQRVTDELLRQAGEAAAAEAHPTSDINGSEEYKREMVRVVTRNMLREALQRARGE
ncbi:MAG: xanthine dehydrogenase family protein subunit M [Chloroflexi bacterium]|nr:xanthine dehydrogenase family protein subunit M [Chloroflexota bacterium]